MALTIFICILLCVISISIIVITAGIMYLLYHRVEYYKSQQFAILEDIKKNTHQTPESLENRLGATNTFLDLLDEMVDIEVRSLIQSRALLNKPYDFKLSKDDITNISQKIITGIDTSIWDSKDLAINPESLMDYVISYLTITLLKTAQDYNSLVRNS